MTLGGSNGATAYQVVYSAVVLQELKRLRASLDDAEVVRRLATALRTIHARLRTDPLVFGEHRNRLSKLRVAIRAAVVLPLFVSYAVHEDRPLVFVRDFKLLGPHKP